MRKRGMTMLLVMALLLGLGGCRTEVTPQTEDTTTPAEQVLAAADAIEKLAGEDYGLANALDELTEKSTATVGGDSYYRLQQNYKGIPVYGRTVICTTDEQGNVISLTGNPADVDPNLKLTPSVTPEQVRNGLRVYMAEILGLDGELPRIDQLSPEDLCIYNLDESDRSRLAYCIRLGGYEFLVDAQQGTVLHAVTTVDTAKGYLASDTDRTNGFPITQLEDGTYELTCSAREIYVLNMEGNNSRKGAGLGAGSAISSPDVIFGNGENESGYPLAVSYYQNIIKIYELFLEKCGYTPDELLCVYNDGFDWGRNALGGYLEKSKDRYLGFLGMGEKTGVQDIDVLCHEYGHVISFDKVDWSKRHIENKALNEAFSDIFGELGEAWFFGRQPDWIMEGDEISTKRNIRDPEKTLNAKKYGDWNLLVDEKTDEYYHSTVISHAAYLMWNGIDGNEAKKLSTDQLAELWYRAMLMMPSDCDFYGCRRLVELAATSMRLTQDQIDCVSEAFRMVGITSDSDEEFEADYKLNTNGTLRVYGVDGELYGNYTMVIGQKKLLGEIFGNGFHLTVSVAEAEPYVLDLSEGNYTLTLTDNANPERTVTFTLSIKDKHKEGNLDIFTDFGSIPVKGTVSEIRRENGVETNIPITDAVVRIQVSGEDTVVQTIHMSETEGFFETSLPAGKYSFHVEAEGYQGASYIMELTPDRPAYLEMVLNRVPRKQLTYVSSWEDGLLYMETFLTYNDWGQIAAVREVWYTDGVPERERNESFFYDDRDRLIRTEDAHSDFGYVFVDEYVYDDRGRLIRSSIEEGGGWMKIEYEYDSNGRLIRTVEQADPYTLVTDYAYDSEGVLTAAVLNYDQYGDIWTENRTYEYDSQGRMSRMETVGPDGTTVETYEYDDLGRPQRITLRDPWTDTQRVYDYSHGPFTVCTYSEMVTDLMLDGWSIYIGDAQLRYSEDGTIVSAENERYNRIHTFYYDGEMPEQAPDDEWKDLYIGYLEEQGANIASVYQRYALACVDGDDIPEIFLFSDSAVPGTAIVWISDGQVHMTSEIGYGGASYQEKQGIFATVWLNRGTWVDTVYALGDGRLTTLHRGRKYSDGLIEWDDAAVTIAEYQQLFAQAFDESTAIKAEEKGPLGNLTDDIRNWMP